MKSQQNRSKILEYIFRNAPIARATIAEDTDITPATVTMNVTSLISNGIVIDLGEPDQGSISVPGRKRMLLDINPNHSYGIGAEFTAKHIAICITNLRGKVIDQINIPVKETAVLDITNLLIQNIKNLLSRNPEIAPKIIGVGIALPGHADKKQKKLITNKKNAFDCDVIRKEIPFPIYCENNVRAMAYGRYLFHSEESPESFALFHAGLEIFCAIIRNGEIFHGNTYYAGEIGHTVVNAEGRRCECGKYGCLQTYSSEKWLVKAARLLYENNTKTILKSLVNSSEEITINDITNAFSLGDTLTGSYLSEALKYLAITTANLAIILNPGKIYLHGELFNNNDICNVLMDYMKRQLHIVDAIPGENVKILPCSVLDGAIGASALAIKQFFLTAI